MQSGHHIISVTLGGPAKPTGLAVVEPKSDYFYPNGDEKQLRWDNHFDVVWLERLPPGREYPAILSRIRELRSQKRIGRDYSLLLDVSVSGLAAVRFFEDEGLYPNPLRVSEAWTSTFQDQVRIVPRRDMITAAQVALQSSRLKVASGLELAATLVTDLQAFDPELLGRGQNTDLVTAVAMALWWGERMQWSEEVADDMLSDGDDLADYDRSSVTGY
jgi:hypothetical protein